MQLSQIAAIAALVTFFGGAFALIFRHKRKIKETWTRFAEAYGLTLELGTYPRAFGCIDGRRFEMGSSVGRTAGGRAAQNRVVEFMIQTAVQGQVPAGLTAAKRGALQGAGPVKSGDQQFDNKVWVDCPDRRAAAEYLTPARREALMRAAKIGAVLIGPNDGQGAKLAKSQAGYKVRLSWFEEQKEAFLTIASGLDGDLV